MIVYIVAIVTLLLLHYHGKRNLHMGHIIYVLTYTLQDATGKEEFTLTISKEGKHHTNTLSILATGKKTIERA